MDQEDEMVVGGTGQSPLVSVKAEKNSRGYTFSATVAYATTVEEALALLDNAMTGLTARYGASE